MNEEKNRHIYACKIKKRRGILLAFNQTGFSLPAILKALIKKACPVL